MKNYFYVCILALSTLFCSNLNAQLFVKDSYVYVADNYLFVKQDVELNGVNSNLYLRNGSQLLQGTTGTGSNKGLGSLTVYQEGTSNAFAYNFWSSPVGSSDINPTNSPFSITQLGVPITSITTNFTAPLLWGSPSGTSGTGTVSIASRWIYRFISNLNYADWIYAGTTPTINAGEGFTMKGVSGTDATAASTVAADGANANNAGNAQRYDFRGKPNDGTISVGLTPNKQTLAGNPYPSAIDMKIFLSAAENPNCDGTALYWEQPNANAVSHFLATYKGGYGIYNALTNSYTRAIISSYDGAGNNTGFFAAPSVTSIAREFCPIAQGFMLTGTATSTGTVDFKNSHRVFMKEIAGLSEFQRQANTSSSSIYGNYPMIPNVAGKDYTQISKAPTPQIIFKTLINNDMVRESTICFLNTAVDGVDRADSKSPSVDDNLPFDQYFSLANTEYVQTTTAYNINKKFALGFKNAQQATFRIKVSEIINFTNAAEILLHDKLNDLYFDIKNQEQEITLAPGINNTRYEITFVRSALSNPENMLNGFDVFQNNVNSVLTIKNPKSIDIANCSLFDVTGKMIFNKTNLGTQTQFDFSTENLSEGIYIVTIKTVTNDKLSKKVIVSKIK